MSQPLDQFLLRFGKSFTSNTVAVLGWILVVVPLVYLVVISLGTVNPVLAPSAHQAGFPEWMSLGLIKDWDSNAYSVIMCLVVMSVGYGLVVLTDSKVTIAGVVLVHVIVVFAAPLFSTDLFSYLATGQLAAHGFDPYSYGPAAYLENPALPYSGQLWKYTPSPYGPFFSMLIHGVSWFGLASSFWLLKSLTVVSSLVVCWCIFSIAKQRGQKSYRAVGFYAANPLVLVFGLAGFHNDFFMIALLMLGIVFVKSRPALGGFLAALALGIKLTVAPVLALFVVYTLIKHRSWKFLLGTVIGTLVVVLTAVLVYGSSSTHIFELLSSQQERAHSAGTSVVGYVFLSQGSLLPSSVLEILSVLVIGLAVFLALAVWRGWIDVYSASGWLLAGVLVASQWTLPWYAVAVLAFSAVGHFSLKTASLVLCLVFALMQLQWWGQAVPSTSLEEETTGQVVVCQGKVRRLGDQPLTYATKKIVFGCE